MVVSSLDLYGNRRALQVSEAGISKVSLRTNRTGRPNRFTMASLNPAVAIASFTASRASGAEVGSLRTGAVTTTGWTIGVGIGGSPAVVLSVVLSRPPTMNTS